MFQEKHFQIQQNWDKLVIYQKKIKIKSGYLEISGNLKHIGQSPLVTATLPKRLSEKNGFCLLKTYAVNARMILLLLKIANLLLLCWHHI